MLWNGSVRQAYCGILCTDLHPWRWWERVLIQSKVVSHFRKYVEEKFVWRVLHQVLLALEECHRKRAGVHKVRSLSAVATSATHNK